MRIELIVELIGKEEFLKDNAFVLVGLLYAFGKCGKFYKGKTVYFVHDGILAVNFPDFRMNELVDVYFSDPHEIIVTSPLSLAKGCIQKKHKYSIRNISMSI